MTPNELARKPASEATFFEAAVVALMKGSITCDGKLSPERHADYAIQATAVLFDKLAQRAAAGGA